MLDNCSQGSFITEGIIEELGITGRKLKLSLKTFTGEKSEELAAVNVARKDLLNGLRYPKHIQVAYL